jgi:hypothetical protein
MLLILYELSAAVLTNWCAGMIMKDRAKLALKVKKFKEQQIQQADEHLLKVLEMLDTVEWESQQLKVFEGIKAGNSVLDAIHKVRLSAGIWF